MFLVVNQGIVEVVLAIWDSLQTSSVEGWWCRGSALTSKVKSKAKLHYFSSTATEVGVVTSTNYYYYNTSSSSSNLSKLKVKTAMYNYNCQSNRTTESDVPLFPCLELHKLIHTDWA